MENNLADLIDLVPDLCEDLLSAVDQPLKVATDPDSGKEYLLCDYNRDGDSYRSPWSNKYFEPELDDGALPSDRLRSMEVVANEVFDLYRAQYYEDGSVSSAYFWNLDTGFAACVLFNKTGVDAGTWDAIHVVEVTEGEAGKPSHYKLTTTIILSLNHTSKGAGDNKVAGHLTRQQELDAVADDKKPHLVHIGTMIEDMELKMRNALDLIYFGKTKEITSGLRKAVGVAEASKRGNMQGLLMAEMAKKRG